VVKQQLSRGIPTGWGVTSTHLAIQLHTKLIKVILQQNSRKNIRTRNPYPRYDGLLHLITELVMGNVHAQRYHIVGDYVPFIQFLVMMN
jgi:hypothetical protein